MARRRRAAGLVMVELAAVVAVVLVLGVLLLVAAGESRRQASLGDNLANLKQFAVGTGAYAADHDDRVWALSWQRSVNYGFGGIAATDLDAQSNQVIELLRRRTGRTDILPFQGWFPHLLYSHLVLQDYLETDALERFVVAPEDWQRILWQESIRTNPNDYFDLVPGVERPPGNSVVDKVFSYSSSYELAPAFFSADALVDGQPTVIPSGDYKTFSIHPGVRLGRRRLTEVAFPSQKAMVYERYQRHFGPRVVYFEYEEARIPIMFADGSVSVRRTADANRGFHPHSPFSPGGPAYSYVPGSWEPQTLNGGSSETVQGRYRWTRSGLRGRDFGGPGIPWTN